jgi:hypothetical protein
VRVYNIDEGVLSLPGTWDDQSVNVLATPAPDGSNFGLVITRFKLTEKQSLSAFVDKHLEEHAQSLRAFELLGRRQTVLGELPAIEAKVRWLKDRDMMFHRLAFIEYYRRVVVVTASSLFKNAAACEGLMDTVLPTLRFRER